MTIQDKLREDAEKYRRWSFESDKGGVLVCKGDHEKSEPCEMHHIILTPEETVKILEDLISSLLRLFAAIGGGPEPKVFAIGSWDERLHVLHFSDGSSMEIDQQMRRDSPSVYGDVLSKAISAEIKNPC